MKKQKFITQDHSTPKQSDWTRPGTAKKKAVEKKDSKK